MLVNILMLYLKSYCNLTLILNRSKFCWIIIYISWNAKYSFRHIDNFPTHTVNLIRVLLTTRFSLHQWESEKSSYIIYLRKLPPPKKEVDPHMIPT